MVEKVLTFSFSPTAERKILKFVYLVYKLKFVNLLEIWFVYFLHETFYYLMNFAYVYLLQVHEKTGSQFSLIFTPKSVRGFLRQNLPKFFAATQGRLFPSSVSFPLLWTIIYSILLYFINIFIKGQCQEIFNHFFLILKDSIWAPYKQAQTVSQTFSFLQRYVIVSSKIACLLSQRLRQHPNFSLDTDVFIFLNYCYWVFIHI